MNNLRSPEKTVGFVKRLRSIKTKEKTAVHVLAGTRDFNCSTSMGALSVAADRPAHENDQSFPTSTKLKNVWSFTTTPPNSFMV
jgi:hypothetical protein